MAEELNDAPDFWASLKRPSFVAIAFSIIVGLAAAASAGLYVQRQPARYQSVTAVLIDQPNAIAVAQGEGIILKLNALRAKYAALMTTQAITGPVAQKLRIPPGEVAGSLSFAIAGPTLVFGVVARSNEAKKAQDIAAGVASEIGTYAKKEQDSAKIPPAAQYTLRVVTPATPGRKIEPTRQRALTDAAIAGGIALVVAFVIGQGLSAIRRSR